MLVQTAEAVQIRMRQALSRGRTRPRPPPSSEDSVPHLQEVCYERDVVASLSDNRPPSPSASTFEGRVGAVVPRTEVLRCGVCGSSQREPYYPHGDIVRCLGCGVLYVSPRPTRAALDDYYSRGGQAANRRRLAPRRKLWSRRLAAVRRHCPHGRLLDITVTEDDFGAAAREHFSFESITVSPARLGETDGDRGLERLGDGYDVITLWHVLERVREPAALLARCFQLLDDTGILVTTTSNLDHGGAFSIAFYLDALEFAFKAKVRSGSSRRVLRIPRQELRDPSESLRLTFFTLRTLQALMTRQGFEVLEAGPDGAALEPPTWRTRIEQHRDAWLHRMSGWAFGSALIAIGQKRS